MVSVSSLFLIQAAKPAAPDVQAAKKVDQAVRLPLDLTVHPRTNRNRPRHPDRRSIRPGWEIE